MTRQGEIREEMAKRRYYSGWISVSGGIPSWEDRTEVEREYFREKIDDDFRYLHSQGVMIKVDRKLPDITNIGSPEYNDAFIDGVRKTGKAILEAGYVAVVSLIEKK